MFKSLTKKKATTPALGNSPLQPPRDPFQELIAAEELILRSYVRPSAHAFLIPTTPFSVSRDSAQASAKQLRLGKHVLVMKTRTSTYVHLSSYPPNKTIHQYATEYILHVLKAVKPLDFIV